MKRNYLYSIIALLIIVLGVAQHMQAQQVTTLYYLENAPMRHLINPALQPISEGFCNFTPLGYTSMWVGNNSFTMNDVVFSSNGTTITAMHPDADRQQLINRIKDATIVDGQVTFSLFNWGTRHKDFGYIYIGINEKIDASFALPKDYFMFLLNGGMQNIGGTSTINLSNTNLSANVYTEFSGGYSYQLNEKWTIGGKIKFLLGQASAGLNFTELNLNASAQQWHLVGQGTLQGAAPINWNALPERLDKQTISQINLKQLTQGQTWKEYLTPQGYGAALDFGFSYRPIKQVQISAAVTNIGFMYWLGRNYTATVDTTYTGAQNLQYSDYSNKANNYQFDGNKLWQDIQTNLQGLTQCLHTSGLKYNYMRMLSANLNVGVDFNFINNILGLGVVSNTRYYCNKLTEEVTLGGAVRPWKWLNLAVSYSLLNNGKYSDIGAGLSIMPYDGINLTLAMDYIPTQYAYYDKIPIPYQTKGVNLALGFSMVWGTNKEHKNPDQSGYQPNRQPKQKAHINKRELIDKSKVYDQQDSLLAYSRQATERTKLDPDVRDMFKTALYSVRFKENKPTLTKSSEDLLHDIAGMLIDHPEYKVEILVYTDNALTKESSIKLSNERANAIAYLLAQAGVSPEQIVAKGMGQNDPVATNLVKEGRERNNRVMFYVQ